VSPIGDVANDRPSASSFAFGARSGARKWIGSSTDRISRRFPPSPTARDFTRDFLAHTSLARIPFIAREHFRVKRTSLSNAGGDGDAAASSVAFAPTARRGARWGLPRDARDDATEETREGDGEDFASANA